MLVENGYKRRYSGVLGSNLWVTAIRYTKKILRQSDCTEIATVMLDYIKCVRMRGRGTLGCSAKSLHKKCVAEYHRTSGTKSNGAVFLQMNSYGASIRKWLYAGKKKATR